MFRISRRHLFKHASIFGTNIVLASISSGHVSPVHADQFAAEPQVIERWMDAWRDEIKATRGALIVGRFADPIYFLYKPITWMPNKGQEQFPTVTAPTGFVTDLASIPRIFWSALRPDGLYAYAAIIHDYLYWTQSTNKEAADMILKFAMEEFHVDEVTIKVIYEAVNWFGVSAWDENKRLKASGEKRILKQFPDDPITTWEEWKKQNVFE